MENEAVAVANEQADKWKKELFDWVETLVIALSVVMIVFTFLFRLVNVKGGSMDNSFHDQDRVVISDIGYTPSQGDVVVLALPQYFSEPIIKRIIAVGGQTVDIDFATGTVYVDGKALEEPYIKEKTYTSGRKSFPMYIEEGNVFVMGDNRNASTDSRDFGQVDAKNVMGRVVFRLFPFDKIGLIDSGGE